MKTLYNSFCFLIVISVFLSGSLDAKEKQTLVIYDLNITTNSLKTTYSQSLSTRLRSVLASTKKYSIVSPEDIYSHIRDYLTENNFNEKIICDEDKCMVEVAGALGADGYISGTIGKVGKTYTIDLYLKDMKSFTIIKSASENCSNCRIDDLLISVEKVAKKIIYIKDSAKSKTRNLQSTKNRSSKTLNISYHQVMSKLAENFPTMQKADVKVNGKNKYIGKAEHGTAVLEIIGNKQNITETSLSCFVSGNNSLRDVKNAGITLIFLNTVIPEWKKAHEWVTQIISSFGKAEKTYGNKVITVIVVRELSLFTIAVQSLI